MPSLNKVILIGNLTADPELKTTAAGVSVCSFRIGVQRRFKDSNGQSVSDFINIVAWRQTAEFISKFFRKGRPICIVGSIQTRDYTDQQGNKRYVTEVVADEASFVESKSSQDASYTTPAFSAGLENGSAPSTAEQPAAAQPAAPQLEVMNGDDDLPF